MKANKIKPILVTGAAGFVGSSLTFRLINQGFNVVGVDNLNEYYDVNLKLNRLNRINHLSSEKNINFVFEKVDIENRVELNHLFNKYDFEYIFHFAAQAGVRFSYQNPQKYFDTNVVGTYNILESIRKKNIKRFFFSSTSSVYGNSNKVFFKENQELKPIQFYATTKLINEKTLESYSELYDLDVTIFRFFTVYGPYGRPDMSIHKFVSAILSNQEIEVFNFGNHNRSFTFIDDIIHYLMKALENESKLASGISVYNLGNPKSVSLEDLIQNLTNILSKPVKKKYLPLQKGDVFSTTPDIHKIVKALGPHEFTEIYDGLIQFTNWYKSYYKIL
jgi:UDP-glucuronate 4-epimerase